MKTLSELQGERNKLATEIRNLGDKFHANDKKWSGDAQRIQWDKLNAQYESTVEAMDTIRNSDPGVSDRLASVEASQNSVANDFGIGREDTHNGRLGNRSKPSNRGFVEDRDGGRFPVLAPQDSFAGAIRNMGGNGGIRDEYDADLGGYLRSFAVGPRTNNERMALRESADADGGYTVPRILSAELIDLMRSKSRINQAGASVIPLTSQKTDFARVASDPAPAWRAELGAVADNGPTFDKVTFSAQSLAVIVEVSRELLEDSVNIASALPTLIATALAQEVDRVALLGSGTAPEPRGVFNFTGINTVDPETNGFLLTDSGVRFGPLLDCELALLNKNIDGDPSRPVITSPAVVRERNLMVDTTGQPLQAPPAIANWQYLATTKVPNDITHGTADDTSWLVTGKWDDLVLGMRSEIKLQVLTERYADKLAVGFLAYLRMDVAAWRESSFVRLVGIKQTA